MIKTGTDILPGPQGIRLSDSLRIGSMMVRNRLYRAPVLEGYLGEKDFIRAYEEHFIPNAKAGIGLIIMGSSCIDEEGHAAPGMISVHLRENVLPLARLTARVHEHGAKIVMQLGHGGYFALEGWHTAYKSRRKKPLIGPSPLPLPFSLMIRPVHALTTAEVYELAEKFGRSAALAREAGLDGVQLAAGNGKLLHQFLTPYFNRRTDEFGGTVENRTRILKVIRESIARHAGADYPVLTKLPMMDTQHAKRRITLEDGLAMARLCEQWGFAAITPTTADAFPTAKVTRGDYPAGVYENGTIARQMREASGSWWRFHLYRWTTAYAARREPFQSVWNRDIFAAIKRTVSIPAFAVGGIRSLEDIESILGSGQADMVGMARPLYAEPDLPARLLTGDRRASICESCNRCVFMALALGNRGGCYNPDVNKKRAALLRERSQQAEILI
ncbi:MAG: NADH:flavin oxidoreductase [Elusimicrobia bacterium]|nr:NADH:flavin oxidoreductase [Elusimicrobiota bacterium]